MSTAFNRILVAIRDLHHPPRRELRKAAKLARAAGATIELYHAVDMPVRGDYGAANFPTGAVASFAVERIRRAEHRLQQFSRLPWFRGVKVTCHSNTDYPAHEAIVRRAIHTRADLLIATTRTRGLAGRLLLRNTDWGLIRECPCPLLLVKSSRSYANAAVLTAVDPFHTHSKPVELDPLLLETGGAFARLFKGTLHAIHVYAPLINTVALPVPAGIPMALPPEVEEEHARFLAKELASLAAASGVPQGAQHLHMGNITDELCATAKDIGASVVVMGAVSRSRLQRIFIGSTAESALDRLHCDVLVVKPPGFKSSLTRRSLNRYAA